MNLKEHLMASAERELGAFMTAVSELSGTEHVRRAAHDWLDELERIDTLPETGRDLGAITIAAAVPAWQLGSMPTEGNRSGVRWIRRRMRLGIRAALPRAEGI